MQEVVDKAVESIEVATEVQSNAADEIVALFCSYKEGDDENRTGEDEVEICKGDQPFFKLRGGQFKKMPRGIAQWHLGKSSRWDSTNPLKLSIKTLEQIDAMKAAAQAKKHALADQEAQAKKAAEAEAQRQADELAKAAAVRRGLLDDCLKKGVIASSEEADDLTNEDLKNLLA